MSSRSRRRARRPAADLRRLHACPDCNSAVGTWTTAGVLHVQVTHDHTCPTYTRTNGGQPFNIYALTPEGTP